MSSHRSHVACRAALGSTVDPLHGLISLGLVDWDGHNQLADSAIDGMRLAATLSERLLTCHEGLALEVSTLARQAQTLASSLDLLVAAHNERLGRLEGRCFDQERELGELRVRMLELELAWEQREFQASSGYASAVGEGVVMGEEEVVEQQEGMEEEEMGPYQFPEERATRVVKAFDPKFDGYFTSPLAEKVLEAHRELCNWYLAMPSIAKWSTITRRFADHSYRCTTGGFHQFYLNKPSIEDQLAHLFPIPPEDALKEWKERKNLIDVPLEDLVVGEWKGAIPQSVLQGNDLVEWTLEQMVGAEAGMENMDLGMKSYVTGRTEQGSLIQLNIHKSCKTLCDPDLSVSGLCSFWQNDFSFSF
ncbi:hypothetical protein BDM02DRAFT_3191505 [Thelephora ganbajun]|uniref:Uncharacterized protein n=1 Tax=Thelephora ganbajun TaxID=370292 RepID=A0ACB6Z1Y3_THEGA|nr:hypothetical protein BDM02DRAFT_3191505 [Thelephora ganbajun]